MNHLDKLLTDVPEAAQQSVIAHTINKHWSSFKDNLRAARNHNHPFHVEARAELIEGKALSQQFLDSPLYDGSNIATRAAAMRLAKYSIPMMAAQVDLFDKLQQGKHVEIVSC